MYQESEKPEDLQAESDACIWDMKQGPPVTSCETKGEPVTLRRLWPEAGRTFSDNDSENKPRHLVEKISNPWSRSGFVHKSAMQSDRML